MMNHDDLKTKLLQIAEMDVVKVREPALHDAMEAYGSRFARSRLLFEEAKKYIPGGAEHQNAKHSPFPLFMDKGDGCYLWDVDGNKFIDFLMASGPILLGHNYPPLRDFVLDVVNTEFIRYKRISFLLC